MESKGSSEYSDEHKKRMILFRLEKKGENVSNGEYSQKEEPTKETPT